jgi:hypothetical protein
MRRKDSLSSRPASPVRRPPRPVAGRWTRTLGTFLARSGQAAPAAPAQRKAAPASQ